MKWNAHNISNRIFVDIYWRICAPVRRRRRPTYFYLPRHRLLMNTFLEILAGLTGTPSTLSHGRLHSDPIWLLHHLVKELSMFAMREPAAGSFIRSFRDFFQPLIRHEDSRSSRRVPSSSVRESKTSWWTVSQQTVRYVHAIRAPLICQRTSLRIGPYNRQHTSKHLLQLLIKKVLVYLIRTNICLPVNKNKHT